MKSKFILPALIGLIFLVAFAPQQNRKFQQAIWLKGAWQSKTAKGIALEIWEQKDDSTLSGKSYFINGKDSMLSESISLELRKGELFYVPTVSNQNNRQPVYFKLTASTETKLVFENPAHDFPQKITYQRIGQDSLLAAISGMIKGQVKTRQFPMKRVSH